jgi:hypothetical protein
MIVAAGAAPSGPRPADHNIMDIAGTQGIYRPSAHLERARAAIERIGGDPDAFVRSHVHRLEALRRAGHVERIGADHWRPALEQHICRHISGVAMPGGDVDWSFGRELGLGL